MQSLAKTIIIFGLGITILGLLLLIGSRLGIGKLPGDILIKKGNTVFYFPLVTCILLSIILTLISRFFSGK